MIRIVIISGKEQRSIEYDGRAPLSIGRSADSAVVLDDERVSRAHCEIRPAESAGEPFHLVDLESRNGTLLNGALVDHAPLRAGDVIRVGSSRIIFGEGAPAGAKASAEEKASTLAGPAGQDSTPVAEIKEPGREAPPGAGVRRLRPLSVGAAGGGLLALALLGLLAWFFHTRELYRAPADGMPGAVDPGGPVIATPEVMEPAAESGAVEKDLEKASTLERAGGPAETARASNLREEEEVWRAIHLEHSGGDLLQAYQDFLERYPAAVRAEDARAVLKALEELRAGDSALLLEKVLLSARELAAGERFAEARALLSAGARLAEREGVREAAGRLEEERSQVEGLAAEYLSRLKAQLSEKNQSGRASEAFREIAGLAPRLGDLPAFGEALLEFERAFSRAEPVHRPPLAPAAVERIGRARAAFAACRFREAEAQYLLALAADPEMAAEDRAQISRLSSEAAQVARMFETAIPLLQEKKPEVAGIAPYPARVIGATAEGVDYDLLIEGGQPVQYRLRWEEVRDPIKLRLFAAVPLGGEGLIGLAHLAWEVGDDAAAEAALLRAYKWSKRWEGQIHAALALHREVPVPEGGFVVHGERLVDPMEKARLEEEKQKARERAEAAERELAAARRDGLLERFLTIAAAFREDGHFEAADRLYRAVAQRFPSTGPAREAASRVKDPLLRVRRIVEGDPPANPRNRITFYFLAEGYPVKDDHQAAFDVAARRAWKLFIKEEPYREYASYLDAAAVNVGSRESGVDRTPGGVERDSALGGRVEWDSFLSDGGQVGALVARVAGSLPRQSVVIGNDYAAISTGGGGISNIPKTSLGALPHEVGHALGGLHDEYDTPSGNDPQRKIVKGRAGNLPARPRPPNLAEGSQRAEVLRAIPWRHWVEAGESAWWNRSKVEVFEGGGYSPVEVWRPQASCLMRHGGMFCVVCMEIMVKAIYRRVRPIDGATPAQRELLQPRGVALVLEALVMKPRSHFLEATWKMEYAPSEPEAVAQDPAGHSGPTTVVRIPPAPLHRKVNAEGYRRIAPGGRVVEGLRVRGEELQAPGSYRFTLEVRDTTPWVLRDEEGLLSEARSWTVRVAERGSPDLRKPTGAGGG